LQFLEEKETETKTFSFYNMNFRATLKNKALDILICVFYAFTLQIDCQ